MPGKRMQTVPAAQGNYAAESITPLPRRFGRAVAPFGLRALRINILFGSRCFEQNDLCLYTQTRSAVKEL